MATQHEVGTTSRVGVREGRRPPATSAVAAVSLTAEKRSLHQRTRAGSARARSAQRREGEDALWESGWETSLTRAEKFDGCTIHVVAEGSATRVGAEPQSQSELLSMLGGVLQLCFLQSC